MSSHLCTRRKFLQHSLAAGAGVCAAARLGEVFGAEGPAQPAPTSVPGSLTPLPARHWERLPRAAVRCTLEVRRCEVGDGERGFCGARENRGGKYFSLVYGHPCAVHVVPIEESFMHVLPGTKALQIGAAGCNLQCKFCNTWRISQSRPEDTPNQKLGPQEAVDLAVKEGCRSLCFTYNEPVVCFEYVVDTAKAARARGLKALCHTAGVIEELPLAEMIQVMDAVTLDLKALTESSYQQLTGVKLSPVLATLERLVRLGTFFEVATPIVTGHNDTDAFAEAAPKLLFSKAGAEVPWQLLRFIPAYQMDKEIATSPTSMRRLREMAERAGLRHVYLRGLADPRGTTVRCVKCRSALVSRDDSGACDTTGLSAGKCRRCGETVRGIWS